MEPVNVNFVWQRDFADGRKLRTFKRGINPFLKDPDLIQPPNLRGILLYPSEVKYWSQVQEVAAGDPELELGSTVCSVLFPLYKDSAKILPI